MAKTLRKSPAEVIFHTPLGWCGLIGSRQRLHFLTFGHADRKEVQTALQRSRARNPMRGEPAAGDWIDSAVRLLQGYASGEPVDLSRIPIALPAQTAFQKRVVQALRRVGYGKTVSYQQLAERAGAPGAARAVGNIMAKNPLPLVVPCHRVIASGGRLGGYSAPQGVAMKMRLLEMEARNGQK